MKRIQTIVTKEYDSEGNLTREITETVTEEDTGGFIYPQQPIKPSWVPHIPVEWNRGTVITCDNGTIA